MRYVLCSAAFVGVAHLRDLEVLGSGLLEDGLVGEAGQSGLDVLLLAHLEVLAEVLVTAPPVEVDHADPLVTADLMEVGVPDVVLDPVDGHSAIAIELAVGLVGLADAVAPVLDHLLLLVLDHDIEEEGAPQVEDHEAPHDADTVLGEERVHLPVEVADGVLYEPRDVLEGSPALSLVSRLLGAVNELAEVAIGVLGQRSADHVSSLVDVGDAVEEALDAGEALAEVGLGVVPVVQILSHLLSQT
eukprot:CAMPEP_0185567994 /NCGR_PEP_ID=MMETSP0434-20130131/1095_1 /TAXON_ID=626734 ORGANISM="Favella taraikaensis, Strain Fe Narragansett Bay" /NCGR_SAMPLE_ID=MMETSP0434 /ASSEMBLY_ACC=CAM_ASM_000379 /LENGTH=244 /DNA_ID=CAMNT_0028182369 /DNA_START=202 /DNA_END=932 /DNA_ORIENTATION=-